MHLGAASPGRFKAHADFHALDRLLGHHGLSEPAVELAIPLGVRAQADGQPVDADLHHATERVALLADAVDEFGHLGVAFGMQRIDGA